MRKRKKNSVKFFIVVATILCVLVGSIIGGFFAIDKILVPNYFGKYGINNLKELVEIVQTIYIIPNEKEFITNPYTKANSNSITKKLTLAGYPTLNNGEIDFELISSGDYCKQPSEDFTDEFIEVSDKEVCALLNQILDSGILISKFPSLDYMNTLDMELKQLIITPKTLYNSETKTDDINPNVADISTTIKITTTSIRSQIAKNLDIPTFLVDWLIPDVMYITSSYTIAKNEDSDPVYTNAELSINSKTPKQSEVLLKLLVSFIYPDSEKVTLENLSKTIGDLAVSGINLIGKYTYIKMDSPQVSYGVKIEL